MTKLQHAARIGLLMAAAAALLGWELYHTEASFADGLRYIHRAERFESESWGAGSSTASTIRSTRWGSPPPTASWGGPGRRRGSTRRSGSASRRP